MGNKPKAEKNRHHTEEMIQVFWWLSTILECNLLFSMARKDELYRHNISNKQNTIWSCKETEEVEETDSSLDCPLYYSLQLVRCPQQYGSHGRFEQTLRQRPSAKGKTGLIEQVKPLYQHCQFWNHLQPVRIQAGVWLCYISDFSLLKHSAELSKQSSLRIFLVEK